MVAGKWNFVIEQGTTFSKVLDVQDDNDAIVDLTGYAGKMDIRSSLTASSTILSLGTASSYMTISGSLGRMSISVPNTVTSALDFDTALYDIELTSSTGVVTRMLEGSVILSKEVTR